MNHLQEEQFSSSVCDPSSQDDSVQAFPEQVVVNGFFRKIFKVTRDWLVEFLLRTEVRGDFNIHGTKYF